MNNCFTKMRYPQLPISTVLIKPSIKDLKDASLLHLPTHNPHSTFLPGCGDWSSKIMMQMNCSEDVRRECFRAHPNTILQLLFFMGVHILVIYP